MELFGTVFAIFLTTARCIVTKYPFEMLLLCVAGVVSYSLTVYYIPLAAPSLFDKQLYGIDINKTLPSERAELRQKKGLRTYKELTPKERKVFIPESLGIVAGAMYLGVLLLLVFVLQVEVIEFSAPIATISVMLLLGFVDDVLNIRWRHKIFLSALGSLPLVLAYDKKSFTIVIPRQFLALLKIVLAPFLKVGCSVEAGYQENEGSLMPRNSSDTWMFSTPISPLFNPLGNTGNGTATVPIPRSSLATEVGRASSFLTSFPFSFCWWGISFLHDHISSLLVLQCPSAMPIMQGVPTEVISASLMNTTPILSTNFAMESNLSSPSWPKVISSSNAVSGSISSRFSKQPHCLLYLGPIYLLYLSLLCIFCTNSINILAGVNGVEVGQSIIIASASVLYNLIQYRLDPSIAGGMLQFKSPWESNETTNRSSNKGWSSSGDDSPGKSGVFSTSLSIEELERLSRNRFYALIILVPFIGVSLGLWRFNHYPSRVFVGDSYTYFAGTVLAVSAIAGTYSKTLLLFFIPQLLNFFISLPQLLGFIPCPPHRVPQWNPKTDKLENSGNYTFLNAILWLWGGERGMSEHTLCKVALGFQVFSCLIGFFIRFGLASTVYGSVE